MFHVKQLIPLAQQRWRLSAWKNLYPLRHPRLRAPPALEHLVVCHDDPLRSELITT